MTAESPAPNVKRIRAALVLLLLGLFFVMWALGSLIYRTAGDAPLDTATKGAAPSREEAVQAARNLSLFLIVGLVLVLGVLFGTFIIVRAGRRYRAQITRESLKPSRTDDVWSTHQIPHYDDEDDDVEPPAERPA